MKLSEGIYVKSRGIERKSTQGVFAEIARKDNDETLCYVSEDILDDENSTLDIKLLPREKSEKFRLFDAEEGYKGHYPYTPVFCRNGDYSARISLEEASLNEIIGCNVFYVKELELKNIRNLTLHSDAIFTPMRSEKISLVDVTDSYIDLSVHSETKYSYNEPIPMDELIFNNVQNSYLNSRRFLNESKWKIRLDNVFFDTVNSKMFSLNTIQDYNAFKDFKIEISNVRFDCKRDAGQNSVADKWFKELTIKTNTLEIRDVTVTVRGEEYYNFICLEKGIRVIGKDFTLSELILGTQGKEGVNLALRSLDCLFDDRLGNKKRHIRVEKIRDAGSCEMVIKEEGKDIRVNAYGHIGHKDDNSYGKIIINRDFSLDVFSVILVESDSVEFSEFSSQNSFIKIDSSQKKLGNINIKNVDFTDAFFGEKANGSITISYEHYLKGKEPSTYRMVAKGLLVSDGSNTTIAFKDRGYKPVEADIQGLTLVGENNVSGELVPARFKNSKLIDAKVIFDGDTLFEDCELMGKIDTEFKNVVKRSTIVNSVLTQCDSIEESYVRNSSLLNVKSICRSFIENCKLINVLCGDNVELADIEVKNVQDLEVFDFSRKQPTRVANPSKIEELPSSNKNVDDEIEL